MKRASILLVSLVLLAGCGSESNPSPSPNQSQGGASSSATEAGSFSHCRKYVGAYMFRVEGLPFTASYRRGIDGACRAADPSSNVAAVAEVAKQIARGETP
jgi:hypothetical protein